MKAPFPYFGGKKSIAPMVWAALGDCKHYIEPFFGSGAVLLNRQIEQGRHYMETINDADGNVANAWRAMQADPEAVAKVCDWPVNHADLAARKNYIIAHQAELKDNMIADPEYYDVKLAGYWIWAASCWIGSGLCSIGQVPHVAHAGRGVHAIGQVPHVANAGKGVHSIGKVPHLANGGKGVHSIGQVPHLANAGKGVQDPYKLGIYVWFRELSERLRNVRVVCGDWSRVCGGDWQDNNGTCGIFFDPPYAVKDRASVYDVEDFNVAHDVRKWALERGDRKSYRIVIAGYDEHEELLEHGWSCYNYSVFGGYGGLGKGKSRGSINKSRECLYFSPHCLGREKPLPLFEWAATA